MSSALFIGPNNISPPSVSLAVSSDWFSSGKGGAPSGRGSSLTRFTNLWSSSGACRSKTHDSSQKSLKQWTHKGWGTTMFFIPISGDRHCPQYERCWKRSEGPCCVLSTPSPWLLALDASPHQRQKPVLPDPPGWLWPAHSVGSPGWSTRLRGLKDSSHTPPSETDVDSQMRDDTVPPNYSILIPIFLWQTLFNLQLSK